MIYIAITMFIILLHLVSNSSIDMKKMHLCIDYYNNEVNKT